MEWISVNDRLPEDADKSVLAHFETGSIETVHKQDWFRDISAGFDKQGNQLWTKYYLNAWPTITHWMEIPAPPADTK